MAEYGNFQRSGGGYGGADRSRPQALPPVKITGFYKDDQKTPKTVAPDLFDKTAEAVAASFTGKDNRGNTYGVSKTQLRRLFDEVKRFEQNLDGTPENWEKHYPYIRMIKSKVSYNVARAIEKNKGEKDVYERLSKFITEGINLVKDENDYHVFVALFEAVYGFYYEKNPKNN
jgi:CRISPR-associated protein Csm2